MVLLLNVGYCTSGLPLTDPIRIRLMISILLCGSIVLSAVLCRRIILDVTGLVFRLGPCGLIGLNELPSRDIIC